MTERPGRRRPYGRAWPWIKFAGGIALAALVLWVVAGRRGELSGASHYLAHLRWQWLLVAAGLELGSFVAFAVVQRRLLLAGGVDMSVGRLTSITLASTAIANSIPAGPLVSLVYGFRQYRRRGADAALAGWTLGAVFVSAAVTLAVVAAAGVAIAGAEGAGLDLIWVTVGVLVAALVLGALFVQRRAIVWVVTGVVQTSSRWLRWPGGDVAARIDELIVRLTTVVLTGRDLVAVGGWGLANWVLDCGCLAISFVALGVGVPWKGLLLAYGAAQLAANLPITPGGLGVVEGSLTVALVAFGGSEPSTVAVVLLYRIMSFWIVLPVGWATWAALAWSDRRPRSMPEARPSPVTVEVTP
ncbi:MAG TPA: lysylphosphatidylglycerol synthase transmembrane domain-containing protein [Acidimicrobiales bacterium]|nr:lysylphosphatidylglycerol synthase transmembrane domain-containing protein [Acidimicrobiales bacterium]